MYLNTSPPSQLAYPPDPNGTPESGRIYSAGTPQAARCTDSRPGMGTRLRNLITRHLTFLPGTQRRLTTLVQQQLAQLPHASSDRNHNSKLQEQIDQDMARLASLGVSDTELAALTRVTDSWSNEVLYKVHQPRDTVDYLFRPALATRAITAAWERKITQAKQLQETQLEQCDDSTGYLQLIEQAVSASPTQHHDRILASARLDAVADHLGKMWEPQRTLIMAGLSDAALARLAALQIQTAPNVANYVPPAGQEAENRARVGSASFAYHEQMARATRALAAVLPLCTATANPGQLQAGLEASLTAVQHIYTGGVNNSETGVVDAYQRSDDKAGRAALNQAADAVVLALKEHSKVDDAALDTMAQICQRTITSAHTWPQLRQRFQASVEAYHVAATQLSKMLEKPCAAPALLQMTHELFRQRGVVEALGQIAKGWGAAARYLESWQRADRQYEEDRLVHHENFRALEQAQTDIERSRKPGHAGKLDKQFSDFMHDVARGDLYRLASA